MVSRLLQNILIYFKIHVIYKWHPDTEKMNEISGLAVTVTNPKAHRSVC